MRFYILAAEPIDIGGMAILGIPVVFALVICWSLRGRYRTVALIPTILLTGVYVAEWFVGGNLAGMATLFVATPIAFAVFAGIVIVQQVERTASKRKAGGGAPPGEGHG